MEQASEHKLIHCSSYEGGIVKQGAAAKQLAKEICTRKISLRGRVLTHHYAF